MYYSSRKCNVLTEGCQKSGCFSSKCCQKQEVVKLILPVRQLQYVAIYMYIYFRLRQFQWSIFRKKKKEKHVKSLLYSCGLAYVDSLLNTKGMRRRFLAMMAQNGRGRSIKVPQNYKLLSVAARMAVDMCWTEISESARHQAKQNCSEWEPPNPPREQTKHWCSDMGKVDGDSRVKSVKVANSLGIMRHK